MLDWSETTDLDDSAPFDQRQLVIVEPARAAMLDSYYEEIIGGSA